MMGTTAKAKNASPNSGNRCRSGRNGGWLRPRSAWALLYLFCVGINIDAEAAAGVCPAPSVIFSDGFESGNLSAWDGSVTGSAGDSIGASTVQANTGTYSARADTDTVSAHQAYVFKNFAGQTTVSARIEIYLEAGFPPTSFTEVMYFRTGAGGQILSAQINSDSTVSLWNAVASVGYLSAATISTGIWHTLEMMAVIAGANSEARLWLDGNLVVEQTNINLGTNPIAVFRTGHYFSSDPNPASILYVDDVILCDQQIAPTPAVTSISGIVFEDVNYGGGAGRDYATAKAAAPTFAVERPGATVELYDTGGNLLSTTVTGATGGYGFTGLPDGDYTVRVVNESITSSRPGATGTEWPVQTFRTDAAGAATVAVTTDVGGADPTAQDDPANGGALNLAAITAQSLAPVTISAAITKADVDFGYNFDTIVNTNDAGQGSLHRFIDNANALTNASLTQAGLPVGTETSLFMIPSDADPLGRPQDPNFDAGRGVAVIVVLTDLPALTDPDTAIDGTTQTAAIGDTNALLLGTGGTVGVDGLALSQVAAPEVEVRDGAGVPIGVRIQGDNATVSGLAMLGFGPANFEGAILVQLGATGTLIEDNVLGSTASSFADPGAALRNYEGVNSDGATGGTIRNNLIGFSAVRGIFLQNSSTGWAVDNNEIRDNGLATANGDGIAISQGTGTFTGNLITGSTSQGFPITNASGNVFTNNTVTGNGVGPLSGGVVQSAAITLRSTAGATLLDRNVIRANYGAGVQVNDGATDIRMTRNSIFDNGTITARDGSPATGQIGIDLNSSTDDANLGTPPFFTLNDLGDGDLGGNGLLNYPVPTSAVTDGSTTTVTGTYNGISGTLFTLEFFSNTVGDPSGYGEGETYRGTDTVLTDGVGNGSFSTLLPGGVPVGHLISVTATDPAGNTSEFSANVVVGINLEIIKRAFLADGTPIPTGATIPNFLEFKFLLYINNQDIAVSDISVRDVLDPAFQYQSATIQVDNSVAECALVVCTAAEELAIFTAVDGTPFLSDAADGDVASYTGASSSVDAGNGNEANLQLDINADAVWAILFSLKMP